MCFSSEELAEAINEYVDVGVGHFIFRFHYGEEQMMLRKFVKEVLPKI